jgi:hypothetical protein
MQNVGPDIFVDRRQAKRSASTERGVAIIDGVRRLCDITDISAKGACLAFGAKAPLPLRFKLVFANGKQVSCQRIWQEDTIVGVQFAKRPLLKLLVSPARLLRR